MAGGSNNAHQHQSSGGMLDISAQVVRFPVKVIAVLYSCCIGRIRLWLGRGACNGLFEGPNSYQPAIIDARGRSRRWYADRCERPRCWRPRWRDHHGYLD